MSNTQAARAPRAGQDMRAGGSGRAARPPDAAGGAAQSARSAHSARSTPTGPGVRAEDGESAAGEAAAGVAAAADSATPLRLGTRRSKLAMAQSRLVADEVRRLTGRDVELVEVTTYGDTSREQLAQIGGTGVFVTALRDALLDGEVDFAVHSLKDLPTAQPEELTLAAIPTRADVRDVMIARDGLDFERLARTVDDAPGGAAPRIGTGSPRRMAQLNAWARTLGVHIDTVPIRGNIDTRIGYVRSGELDAVVLAAAGMQRIGRLDEATELLAPDSVLPAPGQGALAVECAAAETHLAAQLARLDDPHTRAAVTAERTLLAALEAGCSAPVGALADLLVDGQVVTEMRLRGVVGTPDGSTLVQLSTTGPVPASADEATPQRMGRELADEMLAKGAAGLMGERAL